MMTAVPRSKRGGRATWVWQVDDPDELVGFASRRGLGELFVHVPVRVDGHRDLPRLVRLARAAHGRGIRLAALGGDPGWLDDPAAVATEWLTPALGTGLFDGVHLDIEPRLTRRRRAGPCGRPLRGRCTRHRRVDSRRDPRGGRRALLVSRGAGRGPRPRRRRWSRSSRR